VEAHLSDGARLALPKGSPESFLFGMIKSNIFDYSYFTLTMNNSISVMSEQKTHSHGNSVGTGFNEHDLIHDLKHFLPAQAPLKDFIHHNTLHAFQNLLFEDAIRHASVKFGYKVSLTLEEYREAYRSGRISKEVLEKVITSGKGKEAQNEWLQRLLHVPYENEVFPRIGSLRSNWKRQYRIDMDSLVHPTLFRVICSYLD
jgi:uncharacterized protein